MKISSRHIPMLTAGVILLALIALGAIRFDHFATLPNLSNLLSDYSYVGIAAVGATLVVLAGGIDLSVGAVVAFSAVLMADLVSRGMHPLAAAPICLAAGAGMGSGMGWLICRFELPPFLVTLAGMFAIRASCFLIRDQSGSIDHPFLKELNAWNVECVGASIPIRTFLLLAVVALGCIIAGSTRFGRNVYAIGGNERSAQMMGVPTASTKIWVYALAGLCSALAGLVFAATTRAGDPSSAIGLELSVIASVVIGGTLLSGGIGSIQGTLLGILILGVIRLLIDFQGNLNSAWTSIATGVLLLGFVCMQKVVGKLGVRATTS